MRDKRQFVALGLALAAFAVLAAIALAQALGGGDADDGSEQVQTGDLAEALAQAVGGGEAEDDSEPDQVGDPAEAEAGPVATVREFSAALVTGDGDTACGKLTTSAADQAVRDAGEKTCEDAVKSFAKSFAENAPVEDLSQHVADSTYKVVEESEDSATVNAIPPPNSAGSEQTFNLVKEDGTWLIDK